MSGCGGGQGHGGCGCGEKKKAHHHHQHHDLPVMSAPAVDPNEPVARVNGVALHAPGRRPDEPELRQPRFFNSKVVDDPEKFKKKADVIIANRHTEALADVADKVYTRDIYGRDD